MENESPNPLDQREQKHEELKRRGHDPYPRNFAYSHTLTEIREEFDARTGPELEETAPEVAVCGRILARRSHGKTGFMDLSDGQSKLQIYARRDRLGDEGFELYGLFDIGDIVAAEGVLFRTRAGELTVIASKLQHLSKCLLPLPEKWHGLTDVELRYRQRYVDLIVNPVVRKAFESRAKIIREIRTFLDGRGYLEVETPVLAAVAGGALARPFQTHHNALGLDLNLRIALELPLKRLLVGGIPKVYELSRIFRNEGISTQHNPEFTMLEFYEAYSDFKNLMDLTESMITKVVESVTGSQEARFQDQTIDFGRWHRYTMKEAVVEFWPEGSLPPALDDLQTVDKLKSLVQSQGIEAAGSDVGAGKLLGALFEEMVEPQLIQPTFIYDYPTELSPLAKVKPDDPETVERFELYIGGMEIANAYSELNDPLEQRRRFEQQLEARGRGDLEAHDMDEDYLRALSYGMPPAAGEGIGIDRLTMVLTDSASIRDVILFPLLRPERESQE